MSDISIVAANVIPGANAQIQRFTAGATITAGQVVYQDTDKTVKPADANASDPAHTVKGIAACGGASGQPINVITSDAALAIGGTLAAGDVVILSGTAGAIAPVADKASGWYVTILGIGSGSNKLIFNPQASGVAVP